MAPVKKNLEDLGEHYIAAWRESIPLTQEQLGELITLSRTTLSKIETSDSPYTQRSLEAMARVFNCEPFELLIRDPGKKEGRAYLLSLIMQLPESQFQYFQGSLETAVKMAKERRS